MRRATGVDLRDETRNGMIDLLNQLLADTHDLQTQAKQAHWNVRGIQFQQLHELFDGVAAVLPEMEDALAERIGALGGVAIGTARATAESSRLPEISRDFLAADAALRSVAGGLAIVTNGMRGGIDSASEAGDEVTADLLTGMSGELDKQLWFVESHLGG